MDNQVKPLEYRVQGRYEYWAIDRYKNGEMYGTVDIFRTRKLATSVANELNNAYAAGLRDGVQIVKNSDNLEEDLKRLQNR